MVGLTSVGVSVTRRAEVIARRQSACCLMKPVQNFNYRSTVESAISSVTFLVVFSTILSTRSAPRRRRDARPTLRGDAYAWLNVVSEVRSECSTLTRFEISSVNSGGARPVLYGWSYVNIDRSNTPCFISTTTLWTTMPILVQPYRFNPIELFLDQKHTCCR
ncbi:hypothetical protein EVAR_52264_1 [Eumeta japonica]|uniref:Uncharacterized protein n=1 Tax=Eumeta variegata TaxID=151549 RepID=A0A4C1YUW4_EUMVA|nr:hypothetical protein EVAR_52264_1 [Eumeta japonica]